MLTRISTFAAVVAGAACLQDLSAIEHIVVFMQENRAFDHYYGTTQGLRGYNDRAVHPLPSGLPAFYQPSSTTNASAYTLPFHVNSLTTSAMCMDAPAMDYLHDLLIANGGRYDAWNTARAPGMGMSYFSRADMPYYHSLLDGFATGDQYFHSTFTCTNPNRMHLFTGSNGLSVGKLPVLDNTEPAGGYDWVTMGEILEDAGVSWKVLKMEDDFDDNGFAWFAPYINAKPGDPLWDKGMAVVPDLVDGFDAYLASDTLPQVTWIVGPANLSEHASNHPDAGEDLSARLIARLQAHPDVYAKTVFLINYDENGGFVDHAWGPTPPMGPTDGASTVSIKGEQTLLGEPIGPAFRVPLVVVSPWTRGNIVFSEASDHTSVIRLIEERFGVKNPNISPWRRAVLSDLTSVFDFANPDYSWPTLPDTSGYARQGNEECANNPPPSIPATQTFPVVEQGTRISRALPYTFLVSDAVNSSALALTINVAGAAGAAFHLFDVINAVAVSPRKYGLASGTSLVDAVPLASTKYYYALHGPNGFVRTFAGDAVASGGASLSASLEYDEAASSVVLVLSNGGSADVTFAVTDNAYGAGPWTFPCAAGTQGARHSIDVSRSGRWYDLSVEYRTVLFARRFMGHMEDGTDSTSDPAMSAGIPGYVPVPHASRNAAEWAAQSAKHVALGGPMEATISFDEHGIVHPEVPPAYRFFERSVDLTDKDAQFVWLPAEAGKA